MNWPFNAALIDSGSVGPIPDQEEHAQVSQTLCSLDGDFIQLQRAIFPLASNVIDGVDIFLRTLDLLAQILKSS